MMASVVVAPADLVTKIIDTLSRGGDGVARFTSKDLGMQRRVWAYEGSRYVRRVLDALVSMGFVVMYRWVRGNKNNPSQVIAEVTINKKPHTVIVDNDELLKAVINYVVTLKNPHHARKMGDATYTLTFTPRLIKSWLEKNIDGDGVLVIIDPKTMYEKLTRVLAQLREQGLVLGFGCNDEWLKPFPNINNAKCWVAYQPYPVPERVFTRVRELLSEFIMEAISSGRYRLNVKNPNAPVAITLIQFREYVMNKARADPILAPLIEERLWRWRKKLAYIKEGMNDKWDVIATVWVKEVGRILEELRRQGLITGYTKDHWFGVIRYIITPAAGVTHGD